MDGEEGRDGRKVGDETRVSRPACGLLRTPRKSGFLLGFRIQPSNTGPSSQSQAGPWHYGWRREQERRARESAKGEREQVFCTAFSSFAPGTRDETRVQQSIKIDPFFLFLLLQHLRESPLAHAEGSVGGVLPPSLISIPTSRPSAANLSTTLLTPVSPSVTLSTRRCLSSIPRSSDGMTWASKSSKGRAD